MSLRLKSLIAVTLVSLGIWGGIFAAGHWIYSNAFSGGVDVEITASIR